MGSPEVGGIKRQASPHPASPSGRSWLRALGELGELGGLMRPIGLIAQAVVNYELKL